MTCLEVTCSPSWVLFPNSCNKIFYILEIVQKKAPQKKGYMSVEIIPLLRHETILKNIMSRTRLRNVILEN